jgi:hypothetical protein
MIAGWTVPWAVELDQGGLLRMKRELLSLHPLDQSLDPVDGLLIRDAGRHGTVMLDLLVDLNALLTHGPPFQAGDAKRATCGRHYKLGDIWFLALWLCRYPAELALGSRFKEAAN